MDNQNKQEILDLLKRFNIPEDEALTLIKSESKEVKEGGGETNQSTETKLEGFSEEDMKKSKQEIDEMEKALMSKKDSYKKMREKMDKSCKEKMTKSQKQNEEKSESESELVKSFKDVFTSMKESNDSKNEELIKSLDAVKSTFEGFKDDLNERLSKIENSYQGRKTVTNRDFLLKSQKDGDGNEILSKSIHKKRIEEVLEAGSNDLTKSESVRNGYRDDLINFNMGGVQPSPATQRDLLRSENIKIV